MRRDMEYQQLPSIRLQSRYGISGQKIQGNIQPFIENVHTCTTYSQEHDLMLDSSSHQYVVQQTCFAHVSPL